jgi:hypothetical protein
MKLFQKRDIEADNPITEVTDKQRQVKIDRLE